MSESSRAERSTQLVRLGTEFGNLTDRKLHQWLDMTEHVTPEQLARAVDKILADPEREHLPRIGAILALLPRRPKTERPFCHWCWQSFTVAGDISKLSAERREQEAAFALKLLPEKWRDAGWFQRSAMPMILAFDQEAFEKESKRKELVLFKEEANA